MLNVKRDFCKVMLKIRSNKIKYQSRLQCILIQNTMLYSLCFADYDAPVGETGQVKAKYGVFKKTIKENAPKDAGRLAVN